MGDGQDPFEAGTCILVTVYGNETVMPFDDLFCYSESDTGTFEPIFRVQPLEQLEDVIGESLVETDAIVRKDEFVEAAFRVRRRIEGAIPDTEGFQPDDGRRIGAAEFQRIA